MLRPPIRMSPLVSGIMRLISLIAVVLPDPDGPTSTHTSPAATSRLSDSNRRLPLARVALLDVAQLERRRLAYPLRSGSDIGAWPCPVSPALIAIFKGYGTAPLRRRGGWSGR